MGTRDETLETSGCLAAIKSNFLRTKHSQDGLLNLYIYDVLSFISYLFRKEILGSGSFLAADYDQESLYYKSCCLNENLTPMLDKILECSLQPKTFITKVKGLFKFDVFIYCKIGTKN